MIDAAPAPSLGSYTIAEVTPQPPDFNFLLADGRAHDWSDVRPGCVATVKVVRGERLRLPSGLLVAAEPPGNFPHGAAKYALAPAVPPGDYPFELILAAVADPANPWGNTAYEVVAAARVVIRDEAVHTWRAGHNDADEVLGYPVDGGTGSFGSPEVFDALGASAEARENLLADVSFGSDEPYVAYWDDATDTNLMVFNSGGGDGVYATWVGSTAAGEVACFLTDFRTFTAGPGPAGCAT